MQHPIVGGLSGQLCLFLECFLVGFSIAIDPISRGFAARFEG